jgi:PAS domain S-box-containing protein
MNKKKKNSAVSVLGVVSGLLAGSQQGDAVGRVLGEIGAYLEADAALVCRKLYGDDGAFLLDCVGFWESDTMPEPRVLSRLEAGAVDGKTWERLAAGETARLSGTGILISPLFLGAHLYGFLALSGGEIPRGRHAQELIASVCRIFELWIDRQNVEKRLNDLIDYMPSPTFVMDAREVITAWNPATVEMTGWAAERIVGKGDHENGLPYYGKRRPTVSNLILHPDPKWEGMYHEFRKEGDVIYSLAFCNALPGGGGFLRTKTQRLYDINHRLAGSIHTVRDVTLERKMEKSLHRSESMYRAISDFAGLGIMLVRGVEILYSNERMARFLGLRVGRSGWSSSPCGFMRKTGKKSSGIRASFSKGSSRIPGSSSAP